MVNNCLYIFYIETDTYKVTNGIFHYNFFKQLIYFVFELSCKIQYLIRKVLFYYHNDLIIFN